jgi:hypothetical protein
MADPPTSMYKVNWDAVVDKKNGRIGLGIVVCDHESVVLAACNTIKNVMVESVIDEAWAAFYAVELCRE